MMMMKRSTELVLIEIMSVIFCYPYNSMCDALHSKILFGETQIFCFPYSFHKVMWVSCSSLCSGSCHCRVHTLMTNTPISKYHPTDILRT
jgi:hypothetical protein